jgi:hypothetical protein
VPLDDPEGRPRAAILAAIALAVIACGPAPPSVPAPAAGEPDLLEARYSCGGPPGFEPSLFDEPGTAESEDHPSAAALRVILAERDPDFDFLPDAGWWLVARDEGIARYIARQPGEGPGQPMAHAEFEHQTGRWRITGWGDCRPTILLDELSVASWVLDPALPTPGRAATQITALVTEQVCTGGQAMGARLQAPRIAYTDDAVLVVFPVVPLGGAGNDCPGNPPTRVTFELREPLGDRQLLDAAFFPPVEPVEPAR